MLRHNVTNLVDNVAEVALVWGSCNTRRIFLEKIEGERKGESAACRAVARQNPALLQASVQDLRRQLLTKSLDAPCDNTGHPPLAGFSIGRPLGLHNGACRSRCVQRPKQIVTLKLLLNTVGSNILTLFALYMSTCGKSPSCSCAGNRSQMTVPVETPGLASPCSIEMSP